MATAGWHGAVGGALLGLALASVPAVILLGSVVHESPPIPLGAVHFGDRLVTLVVIGAVVGAFN